jgi:membrane-associated phospholipid phosphatase
MALPLVRRRTRIAPVGVLAGTALAPVAAAVLAPRNRGRDVLVCALQMYAYIAAYKMPNDDIAAHESRVHVRYPIVIDRVLGAGELPTVRLQRAMHPDGRFTAGEKLLVWAHWTWFAVPHAALGYLLARDRDRFVRAAVMTYAVFDLGAVVYWALPTAPPWYAARADALGPQETGATIAVQRLMVEYGEGFWKERWEPLYALLGGNPLAAMPSLHFATSVMAALLLAESGPLAGAVGAGYAGVLGVSLVYLGEHYVVDLLAGAALTLAVRRSERAAGPPIRRAGRAIGWLARRANRPAPS